MKISIPKHLYIYISLIGIFLSSTYLYVTPYICILNFQSALEASDDEEARKYISFPSLRRSLKDQLKVTVTKAIEDQISRTPFAAFGLILINPIVNGVVDSTISPAGLRLLLSQGKISKPSKSIKRNNKEDKPQINKNKISLYYQGINRFILSKSIDDVKEPIKTLWKRENLFHWRLNSIQLPYEIISID